MFIVDNDPDASPPCRLLHIVEGGDATPDYRNADRIHPRTHPDHDTTVWPPREGGMP